MSYEISPTTRGGAGVLIASGVRQLIAIGHEVVLLLDIPKSDYDQFMWHDRLVHFQSPEMIRAYLVQDLCNDIPLLPSDFDCDYLWRSFRFHWALRKVYSLETPDIIEFFDYCGVAYHALSSKITEGEYKDSVLAIRIHNTIEVIDANEPTRLDRDRIILYGLEHQSLRFAEAIVYPSEQYIEEAYKPHYPEKWFGVAKRSTPPLDTNLVPSQEEADRNIILFYGRLFGFKGVDQFIDAAIRTLGYGPVPADFTFVAAGYESEHAPDGSNSYREYLEKRIPSKLKHRFDFPGYLEQERLTQLLSKVRFAVFPNRFESFGYAAHELHTAGIPLILNDIPAFRAFFEDAKTALFYDGTVEDLGNKMRLLIENEEITHLLTRNMAEVPADFSAFYADPPTSTWIRSITRSEHVFTPLVCVIRDGEKLEDLWGTISRIADDVAETIILDHVVDHDGTNLVWLFGKSYGIYDGRGFPIPGHDLRTSEALLLLRAGDCPAPRFLTTAANVLKDIREISFVGSWKRTESGTCYAVDTFPLDAVLEEGPFRKPLFPTRLLMRTPPGRLLIDLFDQRLGDLGEIEYLWNLENRIGPGVIIPEVLLTLPGTKHEPLSEQCLSLLLMGLKDSDRYSNIAKYLTSQLHDLK